MGVLSLTAPGVWFGDAAQSRKLVRDSNEYFARMVVDHPKRFGFFAALPLPDVDGGLQEIAYGTMAAIRKLVPPSHMVFGTDFPFRGIADQAQALNASGVFTAAELDAINRGNAVAMLPRIR